MAIKEWFDTMEETVNNLLSQDAERALDEIDRIADHLDSAES